MNKLRDDLPALPPNSRIARLPVDERGYPVPWFVQWMKDGKDCEAGEGTPDFRVVDGRKLQAAHNFSLCWVCGGRLGHYYAFVLGPMCALNRTSGEPPSHRECALWSAQACPFLVKPQMRRREDRLPDEVVMNEANLRRNPGVAMVWVTRSYRPWRSPTGLLFKIGPPEAVFYFREGRKATCDEVMESIDSGLPLLEETAALDGDEGLRELRRAYEEMKRWVAETA